MSTTLPHEFPYEGPLPEQVFGYVSALSQGRQSVFSDATATFPANTDPFHAKTDDRDEARRALESIGFTILAESPIGFAVVGPPAGYEELTGGTVTRVERLMQAESGFRRYVTHLDIVGSGQPAVLGLGAIQSAHARLEGVFLERPRIPTSVFPSPAPPNSPQFHLRVPDDVAMLLGAAEAHRNGQVGQGVSVAMVDTGQFLHPFFIAHRYQVKPGITVVPGTDPTKDPVGHGTGESANPDYA